MHSLRGGDWPEFPVQGSYLEGQRYLVSIHIIPISHIIIPVIAIDRLTKSLCTPNILPKICSLLSGHSSFCIDS